VLVAHELTEKLRGEAERAGAAGVLNKDDLSPRRFAECVDRALRGPVEESAPAPAADLDDFPVVTAGGSIAPVEVAAAQYYPGGNLAQKIERGMPVSNAVDYLAQIMRGLGAVHAQGILHLDIKPTNLLFREDGTLVLGDLATEREFSDNPGLTTRSLVGDLNYVSPESIRPGTVDLRSDLYSAGVVLYQMLTGTTPFGGATAAAMLEAHLSAPIPRLPPSSAALQPLVDGLLAKDPNERFQSAADVLDGIDWLCLASD